MNDLSKLTQHHLFLEDNVGGAIGLYPNGHSILRELDPELLRKVRAAGRPFITRHWMRHDGSAVATAEERWICRFADKQDEDERSSLGIRRWKLQKILYQACVDACIELHMNHVLQSLTQTSSAPVASHPRNKPNHTKPVHLTFTNGHTDEADMVFGCDGVKSAVRASIFGSGREVDPEYTGLTILMGAAPLPRGQGICFPSSITSHCHAVFYPTGTNEQVLCLLSVMLTHWFAGVSDLLPDRGSS